MRSPYVERYILSSFFSSYFYAIDIFTFQMIYFSWLDDKGGRVHRSDVTEGAKLSGKRTAFGQTSGKCENHR